MNSILDVMSLIGSFLIIVGVLVLTYYASRWYARRMGGGGSGKHIRIVDRVGLGQASSLVITEVAGKYYLIGMSEKNIRLISELDDFNEQTTDPSSSAEDQIPFGQIVRGLLNKAGQSAGKRDDGGTE